MTAVPDNTPTPDTRHPTPYLLAAFALLLTLLPYLVGYAAAGNNRFLWLGANIDDAAVYFSWMRQGQSGSLHVLNQFTTDAQPGQLANPLFVLLGLFSRFTGLPLAAMFHLARLGFGFGLLMLVWKFICLTVNPFRARVLAYLFVCFSAGSGWLPLGWETFATRATCPPGPIDLWQTEAITFLSLCLNPLFLAAMCLQIGILTLMLHGERTGKIKYAVWTGLCGLLLALVHSYDVLTLSAVWIVYLLVHSRHTFDAGALVRAGVAGIITAPGVLLIYRQFHDNPIFQARANVETLTAYPHWILLGYGLTFALALYTVIRKRKTAAEGSEPQEDSAFLLNAQDVLFVWAIVNLLLPYLPGLAFQRKLLQGAHFPLAILAGIGTHRLIEKFSPQADAPRFGKMAFVLTLVLAMSNIVFLGSEAARFAHNETKTGFHRPTLLPGESEALQWLSANTSAEASIQPLPWQTLSRDDPQGHLKRWLNDMTLAAFTPALTGRKVYCGHFGETPDYYARLNEIGKIALGNTPDAERLALLQKMHVQYLIFSQKNPSDEPADILFPQFRNHAPLPAYLQLVHSNADADIYAIRLP